MEIFLLLVLVLLVVLVPTTHGGFLDNFSLNLFKKEETCPISPITQKDITDAVLASQASYKDDHVVNNIIGNTGYKISHIVQRSYRKEGIKFIVAESKDATVIAFRGTRGHVQLAQEASSLFKRPDGKRILIEGKVTRVVSYFWNAFAQFKNDLNGIESLWNSKKKVIITGHSLGGALAAIFALHAFSKETNLWHHVDSRLITFGEPRVGNGDFAKVHNNLIPPAKKLRVINKLDIVPHLPPYLLDFRHHARELWLKDSSEWKVCQRKESIFSCSNKHPFDYTEKDHDIKEYISSLNKLPSKYVACVSVIFGSSSYNTLEKALEYTCNR